MNNTTARTALSGALLISLAGLAQTASAIPFGEYQLGSHHSGSQTPPAYGLRLDDLISEGVYTFDFSDSRSDMWMNYDEDGIHIYGVTWGGLDIGGAYQDGQLFSLDFMFNTSVTRSSELAPQDPDATDYGFEDVLVRDNFANYGTLTGLTDVNDRSSVTTWLLRDHADHTGLSFRMGDEGSGNGHRGHGGVSGWGWLDYSLDGQRWGGSMNGCCSDFLFTVSVPEPSSVALLGLGLIGFTALRRRVPARVRA